MWWAIPLLVQCTTCIFGLGHSLNLKKQNYIGIYCIIFTTFINPNYCKVASNINTSQLEAGFTDYLLRGNLTQFKTA